MRSKSWAFAAIASLALVCATGVESQPAGSVPYQTNRPDYRTNTPVVGHMTPSTVEMQAPSFGCVQSRMGNQAVRNPGSAGPALTGNSNNCQRATAPETGVIRPH